VALGAILGAAALYLTGVVRVRRRGGVWPLRSTALFLLLGLGTYAVVTFSILGVDSGALRWAFTTRIALLLLAVPPAIAAGRPIALLRASLGAVGAQRLERVLRSRPVRLLGNAMFAAIFSAALFALFLTPAAGIARATPWVDATLTAAVPLVGLLMVLPIAEDTAARSSMFLIAEFLLAFVELLIDAIPGIVLRLSHAVLDHGPRIVMALSWWPSPLRDQQLAGDLLWCIAEGADLPIIVLLLVRWARSDKRESRAFDDLTDEQLEQLNRDHLARWRDARGG
jgi:cytochrome c oxidase assembly factor CtaG